MLESTCTDIRNAIRVNVRFGAGLRSASGVARETLVLERGSTVKDLRALLMRLHPDVAPALRSALLIADGHHVLPDRLLGDGEEVACLTPVAGG